MFLMLVGKIENERAIQLYNKLDFVIEGTLTWAIKIDGTYFDEYSMGLQFS